MYVKEPHLAKPYRQDRYALGCPRGYSNMLKPKNEPKVNNGASALSSASVIVFESASVLTELVLAARDTNTI